MDKNYLQMNYQLLVMALASALFCSCNSGGGSAVSGNANATDTSNIEEESTPIDATSDTTDMHDAQNALDVTGIYKGVLPCADCEGIATEISLEPENKFAKRIIYQGKGDGKAIVSSGTYTWTDGNTISLTGVEEPNQYAVGEQTLTALDMEGNKITGALESKYVLQKQ